MISAFNEKMYQQYLNKKKVLFLIFLLVSLAVFAICILFLFISKRGQVIYLITNIVLTIIYGFYVVYYVTTINRLNNEKIFQIKKVMNANSFQEYARFISLREIKEISNLKTYIYRFEDLNANERELYCFELIDFEKDQCYLLESKLDYLIKYEVHYENKR